MASESKEPDCYEAENGHISFPFIKYNTDDRLAEYADQLNRLYDVYLCLKRIPKEFTITQRIDLDIMKDMSLSKSPFAIQKIIDRVYPDITDAKKAILSGLFIKLYAQQHYTIAWPPEHYPENTMPALYTINGYTDEPMLDSIIRLLSSITNGEKHLNLNDTFDYLKRTTSLKEIDRILTTYCDPEWKKVNTLMPDGRTFYFSRDPNRERFFNNIKGSTWKNYIYGILDSSYWTDIDFIPYYGKVFGSDKFRAVANRDQQCFFILPQDVDPTTYRIFDGKLALEADPENVMDSDSHVRPLITNFQWIKVNHTLRAPVSNGVIYMYQGNRLTDTPHPEVILAISKGVVSMSDHMRELFPMWGTEVGIASWVSSTLEGWSNAINAMTDPHSRFVQRYLYKDVYTQIYPELVASVTTKEALPRIDTNIKRLAANAATTDPNAMFGRIQNFQQSYSSVLAPLKAAGSLVELQERNKGKRWYGAAIESKDAYRAKIKTYIARIQQALGGPSEVSTEVDVILKLARTPKPNTRDLYARFDAWRETLDRTKLPAELVRKIDGVRSAGFFTGATGYAATIAELVLATQQTGKQIVAGAVLDTTLVTVSSGVRALEQDLGNLPQDSQTVEMVRLVHEIPSYTKGAMDPRIYLVTVFDGLKHVYEMYTAWKPSRPAVTNLAGGGERRKTRTKSKEMRRGTRKQHGGAATGMPLAYYQDGAQMRGTYAEPTGVGLGASTNSMVRSEISQTGGRRKEKQQAGGFLPSMMGPVVQNGMYLMPVASYMGYKLLKGKHGRSSGSRFAGRTARRLAHRGPRSTQKKRRTTRHRSR